MQGVKPRNILLFTEIVLFGVSSVFAQELENRKYTNLPVGLNFVGVGYAFTAGGVVFDPTIPLDNANIRIHGPVMAYVRSIKIGGMSGIVNMVLPYAWLSGSADYAGERVYRDVSGFGDPRVGLTVNFVGSPALSLSEYRNYSQNLVVGASMQVHMPVSQYNPENLVNIGTNRFTLKPELGISKALGHLSLELSTSIAFFTVNNDFAGGRPSRRPRSLLFRVMQFTALRVESGWPLMISFMVVDVPLWTVLADKICKRIHASV